MRKRDREGAAEVLETALSELVVLDRWYGREMTSAGLEMKRPYVCKRGVLQLIKVPKWCWQIVEQFSLCQVHSSAQARAHGPCYAHPLVTQHVLSAWRLGGEVLSQRLYQPKFDNYRWCPSYGSEYDVSVYTMWRQLLEQQERFRG